MIILCLGAFLHWSSDQIWSTGEVESKKFAASLLGQVHCSAVPKNVISSCN